VIRLFDCPRRIETERAELWDRVGNDRKTYTMTLWDWQKIEIAPKAELDSYQKAGPQ
jgi:hypothetical protein